jgi:sterol desaturase/sphingolipid hydroxylase (fatty acid hydroxylase superfamily)
VTAQDLVAEEGWIRFAGFALVLTAMLSWQAIAPRRPAGPLRRRWPANLGMVAIDALMLRLLFPTAGVAVALFAAERGIGLFHVLPAAEWLAVALSVVLFDLAIYGQHVATHFVPFLWRIHRVHHSDVAFDATTAVRFHPAEIALSMVYKLLVIVILGAPAVAVVLFDVLLNGCAVFNHGNVRLGASTDRLLRSLIVTPDLHRVHHSVHREETDSNFGFCLSVWDRMFGTYRGQPRDGHTRMVIGLETFRDDRAQRLDRLLLQPLNN